MYTIYMYLLDTLADWELGYITSELNSGRFFKKDAPRISLKTVGYSNQPIRTMGGLTVVPDGLISDILVSKTSVLLLPGATTWHEPKHKKIIEIASEILSAGGVVGAICGATAALATAGLLDNRSHTSNGAEYLKAVSPTYLGQNYYIDAPSVIDDNLITAGSAGSLMFARLMIDYLDVFRSDTLTAWYDYFNTGNPNHFFIMMQTLTKY